MLNTIRKLEATPKKVHLAFPIDHEDESGEKSIEKAQDVLTKLKPVR